MLTKDYFQEWSRVARHRTTVVGFCYWQNQTPSGDSRIYSARLVASRTIPMFGHEASERLALSFLLREQRVLCLIRRPTRSIDRTSEFFLLLYVATNNHSGSDRSIELIQYTKRLDKNA